MTTAIDTKRIDQDLEMVLYGAMEPIIAAEGGGLSSSWMKHNLQAIASIVRELLRDRGQFEEINEAEFNDTYAAYRYEEAGKYYKLKKE